MRILLVVLATVIAGFAALPRLSRIRLIITPALWRDGLHKPKRALIDRHHDR